jgi:hypothetical protein
MAVMPTTVMTIVAITIWGAVVSIASVVPMITMGTITSTVKRTAGEQHRRQRQHPNPNGHPFHLIISFR